MLARIELGTLTASRRICAGGCRGQEHRGRHRHRIRPELVTSAPFSSTRLPRWVEGTATERKPSPAQIQRDQFAGAKADLAEPGRNDAAIGHLPAHQRGKAAIGHIDTAGIVVTAAELPLPVNL